MVKKHFSLALALRIIIIMRREAINQEDYLASSRGPKTSTLRNNSWKYSRENVAVDLSYCRSEK
jgi:hypothetical protein